MRWYNEGKGRNKHNSIIDVLNSIKFIHDVNLSSPSQTVLQSFSAGNFSLRYNTISYLLKYFLHQMINDLINNNIIVYYIVCSAMCCYNNSKNIIIK